MSKQQNLSVYLFPLIAVLIWSMNIVVTRYAVDFISPISISFYRWLIAFLVLTPFVIKQVWQQRDNIQLYWWKLAILSAFGMVFYQGFSYTAAHYTTALNMGIINAFIPIFTIVVALLILKIRPELWAIIGALVSIFGLVLVISQGRLDSLMALGQHTGDLMMIVAVFLYAFYGVYLQKWQIQLPLIVSLYVQVAFAVFYHLPLIGYWGLDPINSANVASVAYAGLFPSIIAPLVWMISIQKIGPNQSSIFMNLMPVFTAVIAYIWLGESWSIYHTIGGVMILIGIYMAQRKKFNLD